MNAPAFFPPPPTAGPTVRRLAVLCFAGFLFTSMVGLHPLADTLPQRGELTGGGDVLRQVAYVAFAVLALGLAFAGGARPRLAAIPPALCLLLGWAWLSLGWADYPLIAVRRLILLSIIVATVWCYAQLFSPPRLLGLMRVMLGALVVANIVAALLFTQAIHQPGELDPALIGAWRGLHNHKNEAGSVAAMAAILWFYHARNGGGVRSWAVVALAIFLLVQSNSKSSLGFLVLSLLAGFAYGAVVRLRIPRPLVVTAVLMLMAVLAMALQRPLEDSWNDPDSLTGRVQIWAVMIDFIFDHPLCGAGYGSFWNVGDAPPIIYYAESWVTTVPTGHNGYLDALAQLGVIGLVLAVFACIVQPLARLFDDRIAAQRESRSIMALLVFCTLHNFTETSLLSTDAALWPMMLIIVCIQQRQVVRLRELPVARAAAARWHSERHARAVALAPSP